MSLDTLDRSNDQEELHEQRVPETTPEAPHLDEKSPGEFSMEAREFFTQEKQLIAGFIEQRHPTPKDAARAELYRDRIQNAEFYETGQLADILFSAPIAAELQDFLRDAANKLRDRDLLSPTEIVPLKKSIEAAKRSMVNFNHSVRDFLYENGAHVHQEDMIQWISRAMGNKDLTARTLVHGIGAEVAVARLLNENGRNVELSSVDQDLRGTDLVIHQSDGRSIGIDVKTGGGQGDGNSNGRNIEVDVDSRMHRDFMILPEYQEGLLRTIDRL